MLTPEEFVAAGDYLARTCPTWSWSVCPALTAAGACWPHSVAPRLLVLQERRRLQQGQELPAPQQAIPADQERYAHRQCCSSQACASSAAHLKAWTGAAVPSNVRAAAVEEYGEHAEDVVDGQGDSWVLPPASHPELGAAEVDLGAADLPRQQAGRSQGTGLAAQAAAQVEEDDDIPDIDDVQAEDDDEVCCQALAQLARR